MHKVEVYLTENCWAYDGVYQKVGKLYGIDDVNEKLWTMLGAILLELNGIHEVTIYNDTRLIEEWHEQIKFANAFSKSIAVKLKNEVKKNFIKIELKKLDRPTIESRIRDLQLI